MKKIAALLILLVVGLAPLALAEETNESSDTDSDDDEKSGSDRMQEVREGLKGMREEAKGAQEMRKEARAQFASRKEELRALRGELDKCRGRQSDECKTKRKEARLEAKEILKQAVDNMLGMLKEARNRVAASDLAQEQKTQLLAELDAQIAEASIAASSTDAVTEESKAEDVKKAAKEVREAAREARQSLRKAAHELVAKKLGHALQRADRLENRLEKVLARLEKKGVDVSGVDTSAFDAKVDEARALYQEALGLFGQARAADAGTKDELMKQATDKLRASHKTLKEAHAMLRGIVQGIKSVKGGQEELEQPEAEQPEQEQPESEENETDESEDESEENETDEADDDEDATNASAPQ